MAPLLGLPLTALSWFINDWHGFHPGRDGEVLLFLTIPLLIFGAHCLDLLDKEHERASGHLPCVLLLVLCGGVTVARAQQTVFNVPTTDVLEKGKVYFELDISAKPNDSDAVRKFSSFVPRVVAGASGNIEIGLNIFGNIQPGPDSTTLVPAFKWRVYNGGDNGWAIVVGSHAFIPVHNKTYALGNYTYTMVQKTFKTKTRVGFGSGFFTKDVVAPNAVRGVGQFTLEHPVTNKFTVASDWFTGKHANGYWTTGGIYKLTKKLTGYAAYSVGNANASKGNHYFLFEVGYNWN